MFGGNHPSGTLHSLQAIGTAPEFLWEFFLGVYCTVWGFSAMPRSFPGARRDDSTPADSPLSGCRDRPPAPPRRLMALSGVAFVPFFVSAG